MASTYVTSIVPGSSALSLGKQVDAAAGGSDIGVATLAIRDDVLSTLTVAEGDYAQLRVSSTGALHVVGTSGGGAVTNAGTFAVQEDGAALTALQSLAGAISGSELQVDLVSAAVTNAGTFATQVDGDALTALQSLAGAISGTELQVDLVSAAVTNAGTFATQVDSLTPGTAAANLGKAADSAAGSTDTGVSMLAVRTDTPATITPIAGDYAPLRLNANGSLWVRQEAAASTGSELNLFSAAAVVAADTASATIDITNVNHVTILASGSDTAATAGFDVWLSGNAGVTWYIAQTISTTAIDGAGNALSTRMGSLSLDVSGVDALKVHAHATETVNASCFGR